MAALEPTSQTSAPRSLMDLGREECLRLLAAGSVGRIAVTGSDGVPVLRPVNYRYDERSRAIVFQTDAGSKLHALLRAHRAAFEVDGIDETERTGWSVVVVGSAEEVTDVSETRRLDQLGALPWMGPKPFWMRIRVGAVSGRSVTAPAQAQENGKNV